MEEQTLLTKRNCHRAKEIYQVSDPNKSIWVFDSRQNENDLVACKKECPTVQAVIARIESDLNRWCVLSWKYESNFEHLYEEGVRAFSGTSFDPEDRAIQYIRMFEGAFIEDLKSIPIEESMRYYNDFQGWVSSLFYKHSRIVSVMITGGANFPTARNNKANASYEKAYQDFLDWREKFKRSALRKIEREKPEEQKMQEKWEALKRDIDETAETLSEIDSGKNKCSYRPLFVSGLYGKLETLAKNRHYDMIVKSSEYIKELNSKLAKPIFTDRHKFWKLVELSQSQIEKQQEVGDKDSAEFEFDGGKVVKNYKEDRLQIFHNEKPSYDTIEKLKHGGWRWSRFNGCWQRQLTDNACYSCSRIVPVTYGQLHS